MLHQNPFFSNPLIYFGSFQDLENGENEADFSETWHVEWHPKLPPQLLEHVALFIDWSDSS